MGEYGITAMQGGFNLLNSGLNNIFGYIREDNARQQNYTFAEKQAQNADARTRALFKDLYSPSAQIKQIKDAGLSPSLMYGGGAGGGSGQAGAIGSNASITPSTFGIPPIDMAQIALAHAQKENIEEDTNLKRTTNEIQNIEKSIKEINFKQLQISDNAFSEYVNRNGEKISLYEFSKDCSSYENFVTKLRKMGMTHVTDNEYGQSTLRDIYLAHKQYSTEIAVLSEEETNAKFQQSITDALKAEEFAHYNAIQAVQALRTEISTDELTESQKEAWNDLLKKLDEKHPVIKDIAIVLGCIVSQFMGKVNANIGRSTQTQNRNINVNK